MQIKKQKKQAGNLFKEPKKISNINKIFCVLLTVILSLAAVTVNADISEDGKDSASSEINPSQIIFKNIEDIEIGDTIVSYDRVNNALVTTEVTKVSRHVLTGQVLETSHPEIIDKNTTYYLNIRIKQVDLHVDSALSDQTLLQVTPNHPLYIVNNPPSASGLEKPSYRIVAAGNVKVGDKLLNLKGDLVEVSSIEKVDLSIDDRVHRTYNIELERYHNYFANSIMVNDKNDDPGTAKDALSAQDDDSDDNDEDVNKDYKSLSRLILQIVNKFPGLADLFSSVPFFKAILECSDDASNDVDDDADDRLSNPPIDSPADSYEDEDDDADDNGDPGTGLPVAEPDVGSGEGSDEPIKDDPPSGKDDDGSSDFPAVDDGSDDSKKKADNNDDKDDDAENDKDNHDDHDSDDSSEDNIIPTCFLEGTKIAVLKIDDKMDDKYNNDVHG